MVYEKKTTVVLLNWFHQHLTHPYATKEEKKQLAEITSLSEKQITTWLINARLKNNINKKNEFELFRIKVLSIIDHIS